MRMRSRRPPTATGDAASPSGEAAGDSAAEGGQDAVVHEAPDETTSTVEAAGATDERSTDAAPTSESSGPPTSEGIEAMTDSEQGVTAQAPPAIIQSEAVEAQAAFGSGVPAAESVTVEDSSGATSEPAPVAQSESTVAESPAQVADSESTTSEAATPAASSPGRARTRRGVAARRAERGASRSAPSGAPCPPRRAIARAQAAEGVATPAPGAEAPAVAAEAGTEPEKPHHRRRRRGPPGEFRRDRGDQPEARDQGERRPESRGERPRPRRPAAGLCEGPSPGTCAKTSAKITATTRGTADDYKDRRRAAAAPRAREAARPQLAVRQACGPEGPVGGKRQRAPLGSPLGRLGACDVGAGATRTGGWTSRPAASMRWSAELSRHL